MPNYPVSTQLSIANAGIAALIAISGACSSTTTPPHDTRTLTGPSAALGAGNVHGYVTLDSQSRPLSVGVAFSDSSLVNLPTDAIPPMPPGRMLILALPAEARAAGYDHVVVNWNAAGHDPVNIYGAPHMDVHFFLIDLAQQQAITPADAAFESKVAKRPAAIYVPGSYIQFPGGVPMMGAHWGDPSSPELLPPPNNKAFTRTFLYGSYDGHFIFLEPMVTTATMLAARTQVADAESMPIQVPAQFEKPLAYPTRYTVRYDASAREYRISLDGLVR